MLFKALTTEQLIALVNLTGEEKQEFYEDLIAIRELDSTEDRD